MRIGVVGGGIVGRATARSYLEYHEVRVYDIVPERATDSLEDVLACDLVFVCLPTPGGEQGLDLSAVDGFFKRQTGANTNFVLRSTVPIGTTRRLRERYNLPNLVHSPEFLTARCAQTDAMIPARNIVGRVQQGTAWVTRSVCSVMLTDLYKTRFPGVPVFDLTSDESEAVKLFQNGFFAVKVAYWNEVRFLADKLGLDWELVRAAVLADGRIGASHTLVPGPDGKRGFGGSCLPKDLAELRGAIWAAGCDDWITQAALERNAGDRNR